MPNKISNIELVRASRLMSLSGFLRQSVLANIALVSPDQGAVEKVRSFGKVFFTTENCPEVVIEKKRSLEKLHQAKPYDLYGNVQGKIALIVDDMVVSGSTL